MLIIVISNKGEFDIFTKHNRVYWSSGKKRIFELTHKDLKIIVRE